MRGGSIAFINKGKIIDMGEVKKVKRKHFNTYSIGLKLKKLKQKTMLKKLGFRIIENRIYKEMSVDDDLSTLLKELHNKGLEIIDVKVKKPSLEDYFIKLSQNETAKN